MAGEFETREQSRHYRNARLIDLMQRVCEELKIPNSVGNLKQSLAETQDTNAELVEQLELFALVAEKQGIRVRKVESDLRTLTLNCQETHPIVVRRKATPNDNATDCFLILRPLSRNRFQIFRDGKERIVKLRWLENNVYRDESGHVQWFLLQVVIPGHSLSIVAHESTGEELKPGRRLLAFLKPESQDIRTIIIFSFIVGILTLTTPLAVEAIVNTIAFGRYLQPLVVLAIIVFVFLLFQAAIRTMLAVVVEVLQRRIFVRVVDDLAFRLPRVPISSMAEYHAPELVNRFFEVVNIQKITAKLLLSTLTVLLQTVIGMTVLAFYHPFLLGYDIGLLLIMISVVIVMGRGALQTAIEESTTKYSVAAWLQEIVRHPTAFKFNGGRGFAIDRADELAVDYVNNRRAHFIIYIRQYGFTLGIQAFAATVLLGVGGYLVIRGQMTLGQLVAAELIVTVILGSFTKLGRDLESFYDLLASIDKMGKLFDLPMERANLLRLVPSEGPTKVELCGLTIASGSQSSINREIDPGSSAAIVGRAGSGKSRLIATLIGQHAPPSGYVLLDEQRSDTLHSESIQAQVGMVAELEVFEGNIEDNIRLGRGNVSLAAVDDIIRRVGLYPTVVQFDTGLDTELKIGGAPLSTDAAIRLLLARALVGRPGLLLIDGTLDRLSDDDIHDVLQRLDSFKSDCTLVVATGRRSIASWADSTIDLSVS